jgi:hypothetical protein
MGSAFAGIDVCYYAVTSASGCHCETIHRFHPAAAVLHRLQTGPAPVEFAGHSFDFGGIYSATAMLIISSLVVYGALFLRQRKLEKASG